MEKLQEKFLGLLNLKSLTEVEIVAKDKEIRSQIIFNYMNELYLHNGFTGKLIIL